MQKYTEWNEEIDRKGVLNNGVENYLEQAIFNTDFLTEALLTFVIIDTLIQVRKEHKKKRLENCEAA